MRRAGVCFEFFFSFQNNPADIWDGDRLVFSWGEDLLVKVVFTLFWIWGKVDSMGFGGYRFLRVRE